MRDLNFSVLMLFNILFMTDIMTKFTISCLTIVTMEMREEDEIEEGILEGKKN